MLCVSVMEYMHLFHILLSAASQFVLKVEEVFLSCLPSCEECVICHHSSSLRSPHILRQAECCKEEQPLTALSWGCKGSPIVDGRIEFSFCANISGQLCVVKM
eukprot:c5225_g1_i1 orf=156-464(+)